MKSVTANKAAELRFRIVDEHGRQDLALVAHDDRDGFAQRLAALPGTPGVYIMRNRANEIIYIGKAVSLRNRVRTYFRSLKGQVPKVWRMVENVYDFEYILTDTELEALVLENQLIKKHKPRYNIRLKDDKTYPYIKVTLQEEWPRVVPTRKVLKDGAGYYGPYPGMTTVYETIELLDKLFPFRTCDKEITGRDARPCMQYFLHRCLGPCAGLGDKASYDEAIKQVVLFLDGKQETIVKQLREGMESASERLEFERAAVFRDRIRRLENVAEQKRVFTTASTDEDVIAFAQRDGEACVQVFFIRAGKAVGTGTLHAGGDQGFEPGRDPGRIPGAILRRRVVRAPEYTFAARRYRRRHNTIMATCEARQEGRDYGTAQGREARPGGTGGAKCCRNPRAVQVALFERRAEIDGGPDRIAGGSEALSVAPQDRVLRCGPLAGHRRGRRNGCL